MRPWFRLLVAWAYAALGCVGLFADPLTRTVALAADDRYGDPLPDGAVARLGTVRFRHDDAITSLVYTPDGKTLLSGSYDRTVRVWDVTSGKEMLRLRDFPDCSNGVAVAPDGKTVASSSGDQTVHLWDVTTGKAIRQLRPAKDVWPESVAFSPDGKVLAATLYDDSLCLWETATGKVLWQLAEGKDGEQKRGFGDVSFSSDGKYVAAGSGQGAFVWEAVSGKLLRRFGNPREPSTAAFSPDAARLATSGDDNAVRLWDISTGREMQRYVGHTKYVHSITFTLDGKGLITCAQDGTIRFWDVEGGRETRRLEGVDGDADCLALSPDGKTLATSGFSHVIRFWDVATGKERAPFAGHNGYISDVAFAADGRRIASCGYDGIIRIWSAADGKELRRLTGAGSHDCVTTICWSPDAGRLASAGYDHTVCLWDADTGTELRRLNCHDGRVWVLAFFPDGQAVFLGGEVARPGGKSDPALVWPFASGKEPWRLDGPEGGANAVAVSSDGKRLAVVEGVTRGFGDLSSVIHLCDVANNKELGKFDSGHDRDIGWVHFAPDGKTLLSITGDPNHYLDHFCVWSLPLGKELRGFDLRTGDQRVVTGAVSVDGRVLATGHEHGLVCIWDVASGKLLRQFKGYPVGVNAVSFAPGGDLLASGSNDTTGLVWDVTGRRKGGRLEAEDLGADELDRLWKALANDEAGEAWDAVWSLAASPRQSLPFLKARLAQRPGVDADRVAALLRDLDADDFDTRSKATASLQALGEAAEPYLQKCLTQGPSSAEAQKRMRDVLNALEGSAERRRLDRALAVLERATDGGAEDLLARLADGPSDAWLTRQAQLSLQRLKTRTGRC